MPKWIWSPPAIPVWPLVPMTWPHFVIDLHKTRHGIARAIRIKLADYLLHELVAHLQVVHGVFRLLLFRKLEHDRAGHVVPRASGGVNQRNCAGRHIPGKGEDRKEARLAVGHGPGPKCLITDAHARFRPTTGNIEGREISHAQI